MAKGFTQFKGLDYDENFAPLSRLEAIQVFPAYGAHKRFQVYHMDVKSAFLNVEIDSELYIQKPPEFLNHVRITTTNCKKLFMASSKFHTFGTRLSLIF